MMTLYEPLSNMSQLNRETIEVNERESMLSMKSLLQRMLVIIDLIKLTTGDPEHFKKIKQALNGDNLILLCSLKFRDMLDHTNHSFVRKLL
jgi:hypothetical protein